MRDDHCWRCRCCLGQRRRPQTGRFGGVSRQRRPPRHSSAPPGWKRQQKKTQTPKQKQQHPRDNRPADPVPLDLHPPLVYTRPRPDVRLPQSSPALPTAFRCYALFAAVEIPPPPRQALAAAAACRFSLGSPTAPVRPPLPPQGQQRWHHARRSRLPMSRPFPQPAPPTPCRHLPQPPRRPEATARIPTDEKQLPDTRPVLPAAVGNFGHRLRQRPLVASPPLGQRDSRRLTSPR